MVLLPKFDPIQSLQVISQQRVTVFCGSPTMYTCCFQVQSLKSVIYHQLECVSQGRLLYLLMFRKGSYRQGFSCRRIGLTEASPITHCTPIDTSINAIKIGSIGVPLPGTEARIVDLETGDKVLTVGKLGELSVRGPQVMRGHWQRLEETAQVLSDDGWLLTGDIAYVDTQGYFFIVNRKKDLIKYKDYSIYPENLKRFYINTQL